ncbi:hypothetical protein HS125_01350 [bacterium]|nr:hypothetical protein [bacterium]
MEARRYAEEIGSDAVFAVYAGRVLCDWGKSDAPTQIHSVRKSLLSALIGIAVSRQDQPGCDHEEWESTITSHP